MDELFRSDNVLVRRVAMADQKRWIITFDNYGIGQGFDRPGFGEDFLRHHGVSAIHVLGGGDDWYQYPEMTEAAAAIRTATSGAERVMTYGSSMGGYAALRFADALGANAVLALSPQYSLDPSVAPDERRWQQDAERIRWISAFNGPLRSPARPVVVYDPKGPDRWHGDRIGQDAPVTAIRLPFTSHPVTTYLSEAGLLSQLVFDTLNGTIDGDAIEQQGRGRRRNSSVYLAELAQSQPASRPRTALALARRAVDAGPTSPSALLCLGQLLSRMGRHEESLTVHKRLVEVTDRLVNYMIPYGDALFAAGDVQGACAVAREVVATMPNVAHIQNWAGFMLWNAGFHDEAREAVKRAVQLHPSNTQYQKLLVTYRFSDLDPNAPGGAKPPTWLKVIRWFKRRQPKLALGRHRVERRTAP
ncbi:MAG: tetratricopeptide repeat protein [Pseudomonadota bacterium]